MTTNYSQDRKNFLIINYHFRLDPDAPLPKFDMPGPAGFTGNMRLDIKHEPPFCMVTISGELEECGTMQDVCRFLNKFTAGHTVLFGKVVFIDPEKGTPIVIHDTGKVPNRPRKIPKGSKQPVLH